MIISQTNRISERDTTKISRLYCILRRTRTTRALWFFEFRSGIKMLLRESMKSARMSRPPCVKSSVRAAVKFYRHHFRLLSLEKTRLRERRTLEGSLAIFIETAMSNESETRASTNYLSFVRKHLFLIIRRINLPIELFFKRQCACDAIRFIYHF